MVWDIEKAMRLPRFDQVIALNTLAPAVRLGARRVPVPQSPIIVAHYPLKEPEPFVLIDGNHRVAEAYRASHDGYIHATWLPESSMYNALLDEQFRRFYDRHAAIGNWLFWEAHDQGGPDVPIPNEFRL